MRREPIDVAASLDDPTARALILGPFERNPRDAGADPCPAVLAGVSHSLRAHRVDRYDSDTDRLGRAPEDSRREALDLGATRHRRAGGEDERDRDQTSGAGGSMQHGVMMRVCDRSREHHLGRATPAS